MPGLFPPLSLNPYSPTSVPSSLSCRLKLTLLALHSTPCVVPELPSAPCAVTELRPCRGVAGALDEEPASFGRSPSRCDDTGATVDGWGCGRGRGRVLLCEDPASSLGRVSTALFPHAVRSALELPSAGAAGRGITLLASSQTSVCSPPARRPHFAAARRGRTSELPSMGSAYGGVRKLDDEPASSLAQPPAPPHAVRQRAMESVALRDYFPVDVGARPPQLTRVACGGGGYAGGSSWSDCAKACALMGSPPPSRPAETPDSRLTVEGCSITLWQPANH
ncbi:hypothetical protein B0H11DRAFT_1281590 [Mycena galericulata]|nr:hypothetical protein B0H11DRAFT_1281590 [Mycena galericulata]